MLSEDWSKVDLKRTILTYGSSVKDVKDHCIKIYFVNPEIVQSFTEE